MAWVKLDDQVPLHEKMLKAGPAACWLWVCGIAHGQAKLTDGHISDLALPMIGVPKGYKDLAETLCRVGLFERVDGGFKVHDYHDHNDSRETVLRKRKKDADRKREKEERENGGGQDSVTPPSGLREDSGASRAGIPSHPIPTRPEERSRASAEPQKPTEPPRRGGGAMAGGLPRDHRGHAACSPGGGRCVPNAVHESLLAALTPKFDGNRAKADLGLREWYAEVWAGMAPDFVMPDAFRFWRSSFDAKFAGPVPTAAPNRRPEPIANYPSAEETRRRSAR